MISFCEECGHTFVRKHAPMCRQCRKEDRIFRGLTADARQKLRNEKQRERYHNSPERKQYHREYQRQRRERLRTMQESNDGKEQRTSTTT